ncbi:HlyC/CorC family transporter [Laribacter hongkongensis]|uniref:HlyC/CorC family transporter n=1 Tax=Laribacter hongkongensis TaxID=168471 RepID=UPI001EFEC3A4|nr:HlyC/CorC family transporter [Laribacter hongkongensis]MCG8994903.1 HlyC/CorC family transporter [Laribacter hongkongensis]MCG9010495.1 HlyC/CorC family transporter [Laribacter hongkongensis]MCG9022234.1 HlyC/CorC family transporter [Laribacter hongkongensis]MCG9046382.1 HlyC/CorC family transporter [Laribacter hongkongensis]MCG9072986.1 HlyC/CorC family transporter [Laribacter hongkongensis]
MDDIPLSLLLLALVILLMSSAFFSMSETGMMAVNRYRLNNRAASGHRGARLAKNLLGQTDKLLGVILLGNNFINSAAASIATVITFRLVGQNEVALAMATVLVTFAILVFSEATPKVIAATHPERVALVASYPLTLLLKVAYPVVWFVNLFVQGLIRLLRVQPEPESTQLTPEELRVLVLESGQFIAKKHRSMLLNLFELENCTVDDVMVPRHQLEMIDIDDDLDEIVAQLRTCHHTRLPVCEGSSENVIGILHVRKVLHLMDRDFGQDALRGILRAPYFIPEGTPLFTQLQNFQENHRRIGIVVDEYGEMLGLVTLEDILEQVVGEFTTAAPTFESRLLPQEDGSILVDGAMLLRDLNRSLDLNLPLEGPKTVNGLLLEHFQDIPEPGTCFKLHQCVFEVLQSGERSVRRVRIIPL